MIVIESLPEKKVPLHFVMAYFAALFTGLIAALFFVYLFAIPVTALINSLGLSMGEKLFLECVTVTMILLGLFLPKKRLGWALIIIGVVVTCAIIFQ
jgi:hypothetical protein